MKSVLFLDVDGVSNPYPKTPEGYAGHAVFRGEEPVRVLAAHAGWLAGLRDAFELVWAAEAREWAGSREEPTLLVAVEPPPASPARVDELLAWVRRRDSS